MPQSSSPMDRLRWSLPSNVCVAFSTIADGDQRDPKLRRTWLESLAIATRPGLFPWQIHGLDVVTDGASAAELAHADGAVTAAPATVIGAYGADCPGVVIAAVDVLGIAHCGWRGTAGGMVTRLAAAMRSRSAHPPSHWQALIGPSISAAQYEVDEPVLNARNWPPEAIAARHGARAQLDLAATLDHDLRGAGIIHVTQTNICTATDLRLHSYRRNGARLVQLLAAWRIT